MNASKPAGNTRDVSTQHRLEWSANALTRSLSRYDLRDDSRRIKEAELRLVQLKLSALRAGYPVR